MFCLFSAPLCIPSIFLFIFNHKLSQLIGISQILHIELQSIRLLIVLLLCGLDPIGT